MNKQELEMYGLLNQTGQYCPYGAFCCSSFDTVFIRYNSHNSFSTFHLIVSHFIIRT